MTVVSFCFFLVASVGVGLVALQTSFVYRFLRQPVRQPKVAPLPGISILKPLCGLDEGLEASLHTFANLDYPNYEVIIGFHTATDPAMGVAKACVERWPNRFRIVLQQGEHGFNPKVNQLITLTKAARYGIVIVSDASVRAVPGYLSEIAAHFEDQDVALVSHSVAAVGEKTWGALFDNLYLMTHFSSGMIAAKATANQDMVLGKSMAFRLSDLQAMGGFEAAKDYLAEDFVLGRWVTEKLHKRVVFARTVPQTLSVNRTIGGFISRYRRWSVMQRNGVGVLLYITQTAMYPVLHATLGLVLAPSLRALTWWLVIAFAKGLLDVYQARLFRSGDMPWRTAFVSPMHDLLVALAWFYGLRYDRVEWRGQLYEIAWGTKVVPLGGEVPAPVPAEGEEPAVEESTT
jgi:ceramide glucosyltransferase